MPGPFKTIPSRVRSDVGNDLPRHLLGNESFKTAFILNMSLRKMVAGLAKVDSIVICILLTCFLQCLSNILIEDQYYFPPLLVAFSSLENSLTPFQ